MAEEKDQDNFDWEAVVEQIYNNIGSDIALVDKYGMVLASRVKGIEKEKLISPLFWSLIENRIKLAEELDVEEVSSFTLEIDQGYMVFVFGEFINLMSVLPSKVNISEILPSWRRILEIFDKSTDKRINIEFLELSLEEEFKILAHEGEEKHDSFPVFPNLITHLAKKK